MHIEVGIASTTKITYKGSKLPTFLNSNWVSAQLPPGCFMCSSFSTGNIFDHPKNSMLKPPFCENSPAASHLVVHQSKPISHPEDELTTSLRPKRKITRGKVEFICGVDETQKNWEGIFPPKIFSNVFLFLNVVAVLPHRNP